MGQGDHPAALQDVARPARRHGPVGPLGHPPGARHARFQGHALPVEALLAPAQRRLVTGDRRTVRVAGRIRNRPDQRAQVVQSAPAHRTGTRPAFDQGRGDGHLHQVAQRDPDPIAFREPAPGAVHALEPVHVAGHGHVAHVRQRGHDLRQGPQFRHITAHPLRRPAIVGQIRRGRGSRQQERGLLELDHSRRVRQTGGQIVQGGRARRFRRIRAQRPLLDLQREHRGRPPAFRVEQVAGPMERGADHLHAGPLDHLGPGLDLAPHAQHARRPARGERTRRLCFSKLASAL